MKFYKPITHLKDEIRKPQERIAMVAIAALFIAISALIFAMGK